MSETRAQFDPGRNADSSNPFSTRFTRPGAIPFHFAPGPKQKQLFDRLWDMGLWGQVVGPHGSGKSTLLHLLAREAAGAGINMVRFDLHDQQRRMPRGWKALVWESFERGRGTMVAVDGYEQLAPFAQWQLKRTCRHRRWGLLVTSHRDVNLPHLYRTLTHIDLAHQLVRFVLPDGETRVGPEMVAETFRRHEGNLRQVFSDLYDRYERLR
ncbi:MAG: ATP-binding protein [Planctomycetota bacterium]|nr:ATP-binding protein [Planctomycetota bacterium]